MKPSAPSSPEYLPLGTAFQMRVWAEIRKIPYGETITYGELARRIGNPKACRAVAQACHTNPLPFYIPCHRVVAANSLGGYAYGLPLKQALLLMERLAAEGCAEGRAVE